MFVLTMVLVTIFSIPAKASLQTDLSLSVVQQQNVRADSTAIADLHTTISSYLGYNILPQLLVSWQGDLRKHVDNADLDYTNHELFMGYQVGRGRQKLNFHTGLFAVWRDYEEEIWRLDSSVTGIEAMMRYYRRPAHSIRLGVEVSSVRFPVYSEADHLRAAASLGTNLSLPTRTGLDFGFNVEQLHYADTISPEPGGIEQPGARINQIGLEGRVSQSLGSRAGVGLSVRGNEIVSGGKSLGDSADTYLAPGVLVFDERSVRARLKYILPAGLISRLSWQRSRRQYLPGYVTDQTEPDRVDDEQFITLQLRKNIRFGKITRVEPVLSLTRVVTESTDPFYDCDDWQLSLTLEFHP